MLTSFDPFGGSAENNTQAIAEQLRATGLLGDGVSVQVCNLPVVYDQASRRAHECMAEGKPDLVVSFGEAGCELVIETAASNRDSASSPDNAGQFRHGTEIVPGGPSRTGFNFPVQAMYCALGQKTERAVVSSSPGSFVCNNTAYHLSEDLRAQEIPFTFIHVPNSRCSAESKSPERNAATIARMLRAAIAEMSAPARAQMPWPHPDTGMFLPATRDEAVLMKKALQTLQAPDCEKRFIDALIGTY